MRKELFALGAALAIGLVCGCRPIVQHGYWGPTDTMAEVAAKVNANNQAIPTLFANHYIQANLWDPAQKKPRFISADGFLMVRKPRELLLVGNKVLETIFELGSDDQRFWLKINPDDREWWGWHRNADKLRPQDIPIQPALVSEVLGIGDINSNFLELPAPTMRFNNDMDVYMLGWNATLPDRWFAQKEIWYDRKSLLPLKVLLFDHNGRIILHANLTRHKPVKLEGVPEAQWPKIASHYDLFFPETKSTMKMTLSDMALTAKTGQPKPGMIRFPGIKPVPAERVIQIDKVADQ
jgi:hypothetical protein